MCRVRIIKKEFIDRIQQNGREWEEMRREEEEQAKNQPNIFETNKIT